MKKDYGVCVVEEERLWRDETQKSRVTSIGVEEEGALESI